MGANAHQLGHCYKITFKPVQKHMGIPIRYYGISLLDRYPGHNLSDTENDSSKHDFRYNYGSDRSGLLDQDGY